MREGRGYKRPGLKLCASGLVTWHNALEKVEWSEPEIFERTESLYRHAKKSGLCSKRE